MGNLQQPDREGAAVASTGIIQRQLGQFVINLVPNLVHDGFSSDVGLESSASSSK